MGVIPQFELLAQQQNDASGIFLMIIYLLIIVVFIAGIWKTFEKAGKPGWASIVPIYNIVVLLEIARQPIWWLLLLFIPFVNIVVSIIMHISLAKNFGKGTGFGVGLALLGIIFFPILGFGDAQYITDSNFASIPS